MGHGTLLPLLRTFKDFILLTPTSFLWRNWIEQLSASFLVRSLDIPTEVLQNWKAEKRGSFETLVVEAKFRRRGFGTLLFENSFELFKDRGIKTVTLSVPAIEVAAQKFCEKFGFEIRGYFLRKRLWLCQQ
jgi:ribosomal protein S18 acetylase RimI-like enzyme